MDVGADLHMDYYAILGLEPQSPPEEVRAAYKHLAKHTHPDVAGDAASDAFAIINRAYEVLSDPQARVMYDSGRSLFGAHSRFADFTGKPLSKTAQPGSIDAVFVDENSCIGCRACAQECPKTFIMDESHGKARVNVQWADSRENIDIALQMCPVNCIHYVAAEDLAVLEFVQRSMPPRHVLIHSCSSNSGAARGMEESPFCAAERFEAKKEKLMADAEDRRRAKERMQAVVDAVRDTGGGMPWSSWFKPRREQPAQTDPDPVVVGPCCPLIVRHDSSIAGPLQLPAAASSSFDPNMN